ncbi:MAG: hypothetical protein NTW19_11285 [Planctomycetota bacterium]|nr:hypothetical protein [Planctomycetota bacterium]
MSSFFQQGEKVVYRVSKWSPHPGRRAIHVFPSAQGDVYTYEVEKYWTVAERMPDGMLRVVTRRGKEHLIDPADERLRRAKLWERLFLRDRFPMQSTPAAPAQKATRTA